MRADRLIPALLVFLVLSVPATGAERDGHALIDMEPLVEKQIDRVIADRRWFHANPELALREFETQAYIRRALEEIPGVEPVDGEWGTGLVAILRGAHDGPLVAWRADMDGLPIEEKTGLPYASTKRDTVSNGGETAFSHSCGHDIHMSVALGAVRVLSGLRDRMHGSILFIFQPAEEIGAGSAMMLEAGLFDDGRLPECVFAFHDHPTLETGEVGSCPGWATANVDAFRLTVRGESGHGAYPYRSIDPVTIASKMVLAFNDIVAREIDVNHHAVISVGSIHGGAKSSIIPDEVVLEATVRSHDDETRMALKEKIERTAKGIAASAGAPEPLLEYYLGTPAGYNDPELVARVREVVRRVLGPENDVLYEPGMGGEDFSRYGRVVPGFQFRLGVAPPGVEMTLHSSAFNPDEAAIPVGVRIVSEILWDRLHQR